MFLVKDLTGACCPLKYEITDRSEMSWSTYVNSDFLIQKSTKWTMYIDLLITISISWKHQSALIYSHVGTYIFYNKINLYCCFRGDGWWGLYNPVIPFSKNLLCPSQQRTACRISSVRNSDWSSSNTQKAPPEKNISLKQKKD